eukprot:754451-Hanusia_phi.AAC.2
MIGPGPAQCAPDDSTLPLFGRLRTWHHPDPASRCTAVLLSTVPSGVPARGPPEPGPPGGGQARPQVPGPGLRRGSDTGTHRHGAESDLIWRHRMRQARPGPAGPRRCAWYTGTRARRRRRARSAARPGNHRAGAAQAAAECSLRRPTGRVTGSLSRAYVRLSRPGPDHHQCLSH